MASNCFIKHTALLPPPAFLFCNSLDCSYLSISVGLYLIRIILIFSFRERLFPTLLTSAKRVFDSLLAFILAQDCPRLYVRVSLFREVFYCGGTILPPPTRITSVVLSCKTILCFSEAGPNTCLVIISPYKQQSPCNTLQGPLILCNM